MNLSIIAVISALVTITFQMISIIGGRGVFYKITMLSMIITAALYTFNFSLLAIIWIINCIIWAFATKLNT